MSEFDENKGRDGVRKSGSEEGALVNRFYLMVVSSGSESETEEPSLGPILLPL